MLSKEQLREMTENELYQECLKIVNNYMKIYDEYYSTNSRDSAFLKDLTDSLRGVSAILEVYTRDKYIEPNYALEKLNYSMSFIEANIKYFESKLEENNE